MRMNWVDQFGKVVKAFMSTPQQTHQLQDDRSTAFRRYDEFFYSLKNDVRIGDSSRILIFGCSSGAEIATVKHYWPNATVVGCDIAPEALRQSREAHPDVEIFKSTEANLLAAGEFDLITANSVFCRNPPPPDGIAKYFPFGMFERYASLLATLLEQNGVLMMYNSNYFFQDLPCFREFAAVNIARSWHAAFVPRLHRSGRIAAFATKLKSQVISFELDKDNPPSSRDRLSCAIFKKVGLNGPRSIDLNSLPPNFPAAQLPCPEPPDVQNFDLYTKYEAIFHVEQIEWMGDRLSVTHVFANDFVSGAWIRHGTFADVIEARELPGFI